MGNYDGHEDFGADFSNQDFGSQGFEESGVDNFAEADGNGNNAYAQNDFGTNADDEYFTDDAVFDTKPRKPRRSNREDYNSGMYNKYSNVSYVDALRIVLNNVQKVITGDAGLFESLSGMSFSGIKKAFDIKEDVNVSKMTTNITKAMTLYLLCFCLITVLKVAYAVIELVKYSSYFSFASLISTVLTSCIGLAAEYAICALIVFLMCMYHNNWKNVYIKVYAVLCILGLAGFVFQLIHVVLGVVGNLIFGDLIGMVVTILTVGIGVVQTLAAVNSLQYIKPTVYRQ